MFGWGRRRHKAPGNDILASAEAADAGGDAALARALYEQAAESLLGSLSEESDPTVKALLRVSATRALERAERLREAGFTAAATPYPGAPAFQPPQQQQQPPQQQQMARRRGVAVSSSSSMPQQQPPQPQPTVYDLSGNPIAARQPSAKLEQLQAVRAVVGDGLSDADLRLRIARHGDDVDGVINELLEELVAESRTEGPSEMWTCPACTLENRPGEAACAACEQPRPRPVKPPQTMDEFLASTGGGQVRLAVSLRLADGTTVERSLSLPASLARRHLCRLVDGGAGEPVHAEAGERVGLPQHASRKAHKPRGPAQKPLVDVLAVEDVRAQLGDGALERLVQSELRSRERSDGNARVNPDVRADAALYDDGVGGAFERSVFIDPTRSARSGGGGGEGRQVQVKAPPLGSDAKAIPVAYETAAVGSRIANMARVGGQRASSREAVLAQRKVLERKLVRSAEQRCTVVPLGVAGAPSLRILTPLGDEGPAAHAAAPPRAQRYGALFWSELLHEVVVRVMGRSSVSEVVEGLYYMPTIRADVFVCSSLADSPAAGLHINVLVFEQSLACDCEEDDHARPLRVSACRKSFSQFLRILGWVMPFLLRYFVMSPTLI
ncbi:hypothetical protein EMIHUDRAFT_114511 [Emiliania huxleyi CCMP1516]|uniref:RanBP2-type domain-containing protein n=2 Tax=Emiliania huxleyi TaxID=2903 RepID=A0A0D3JVM1_EMIH1|nr:hypothetical protein EMIHUDRAFT_114511 [Emiliania huxleyi CCMP1516]EOD27556.1 hypothetical protein EMIHUDRAFT_114511 [Emiliania huxleyi CCMP1516]|eukprot:XP_005779985.1 hypothetical protein EMIHUDRAFT_114511 [Emiliania huxleyi CCMP1516]